MENFYIPKPQYLWNSTTGIAPVIGRVRFLEAGTTDTLKAIYDKDGDPLQNPLPTDANGYTPQVFLGEGSYKVVLQRLVSSDPTDVYDVLWECDNVKGADSSSAPLTTTIVNTIADLKALASGAYSSVSVLGYFAAGDGGGGSFRWNAVSTTADDGGTWIIPNSAPANGRWIRQYALPEVTGAMYGSPLNSGETQDSRLLALNAFAKSTGYKATLQAGVYKVGANITLDMQTLELRAGAKFRRFATSYPVITLSPDVLIIDHAQSLQDEVVNFPTISPKSPIYSRPEWWGADGTGTADAYSAIKIASEQKSGLVEFTKTYKITAAGAPSPLIALGHARIAKGAFFDFDGGGVSRYFTINSISVDPTAMGVFGGNTCRQELGIKCQARAEWFYATNGASTAGHQQTALEVSSGANSWRGRMIIGAGDTGSITWNFVPSTLAQRYIVDTIIEGVTLNVGGGATDYATRYIGATLDSVGGGVVGTQHQNLLLRDHVYPEAFGAFSGAATSEASVALKNALQVCARNSLMLDGRGRKYSFVNAVLVNELGNFGIKNAHLVASGTDCLISNITTGSRTITLTDSIFESDLNFSLEFSSCTQTDWDISNCRFVSRAQIAGAGSCIGSRFGDATLSGSSGSLAVSACQITNGSTYGEASFYGCTIDNTFAVLNPNETIIQGCHFRGIGSEALHIGSTSYIIATKLIVINNIFDVGLSTIPIAIDASMLQYGHDAKVYDNSYPYGDILSTRPRAGGSAGVTGAAGGNANEILIDTPFLISTRCLPYQKNPKYWNCEVWDVKQNAPNFQDRFDAEARLMPASVITSDLSLYIYNPSVNYHIIHYKVDFNWEKP